jgi:hypothetical protein
MEPDFEEKLVEMIPAHCQNGIRVFVLEGRIPGHFLKAVLSNDLKEAVGQADDVNLTCLRQYVRFLYNYAPQVCWGSVKKMENWAEIGGYVGWSKAGYPNLETTLQSKG